MSRADMAEELALGSGSPVKTYVVEAHTENPTEYLSGLVDSVETTGDAFLFRTVVNGNVFWVDQLDERFWRFHTTSPNAAAFPILREWVGSRRELDWMWLPSEHLRRIWPDAIYRRVRTDFRGGRLVSASAPARDMRVQLLGQDAEHLLELISRLPEYSSAVSFEGVEARIEDPSFGWVKEGVNRMGRFAASGDSFELHLQFVGSVVDRYRNLVVLCEQRAISWSSFGDDQGGSFSGEPLVLNFSRQIDDVAAFADELTSCREPFRLWGIADIRSGIAEVEAVDLHVGQAFHLDIANDWMRIYLRRGVCGNTVARLIANLQHHFDGALTLADPELDAAARNLAFVGA